jgi:hypothetical protein
MRTSRPPGGMSRPDDVPCTAMALIPVNPCLPASPCTKDEQACPPTCSRSSDYVLAMQWQPARVALRDPVQPWLSRRLLRSPGRRSSREFVGLPAQPPDLQGRYVQVRIACPVVTVQRQARHRPVRQPCGQDDDLADRLVQAARLRAYVCALCSSGTSASECSSSRVTTTW